MRAAFRTGRVQPMPTCAISPSPVMTLPIEGSDAVFPVPGVCCIGRNDAAHAIGIGHDSGRKPRFFFPKNPRNPATGPQFASPAQTGDLSRMTLKMPEMISCPSKYPELAALPADRQHSAKGLAIAPLCVDAESL